MGRDRAHAEAHPRGTLAAGLCAVCFGRPGANGPPRLFSGAADETVRAWDASTGALLCALKGSGHAGWVRLVAVSPDGAVLASCADDKTVRCGAVRHWRAASGELIKVLAGHTEDVYSLAFAPDGAPLSRLGRRRHGAHLVDVAHQQGPRFAARAHRRGAGRGGQREVGLHWLGKDTLVQVRAVADGALRWAFEGAVPGRARECAAVGLGGRYGAAVGPRRWSGSARARGPFGLVVLAVAISVDGRLCAPRAGTTRRRACGASPLASAWPDWKATEATWRKVALHGAARSSSCPCRRPSLDGATSPPWATPPGCAQPTSGGPSVATYSAGLGRARRGGACPLGRRQ